MTFSVFLFTNRTSLEAVLLVLACLTTLGLAGALVDFARGARRMKTLSAVPPAVEGPTISIVVAARNEERGIEAAVESLLRLDYPSLEIVIVDDRSTDGTGAILDRLAGRDRRLNVIHLDTLPDGWLGKNHALTVGAEQAKGALLLFTDADVVFEPTTLRRAVTLMEAERIDHLAAIPDVQVRGLALNAFVAAFGVFFSLYARPWKVADPRSSAHIGVGAFNMIRATTYRAIGTHRLIAMRPDDDLKLGKLVKKNGFRQEAVSGLGSIVVEWYTSIAELVDGLMKNAFAGVNYSVWALAAATIGLLVMNVWPFVGLVVTSGATRVLNGASVAALAAIFWTTNRWNGARFLYFFAFPVAALLFAYIMWRSAALAIARGSVMWRGTAYSLKELRANRV